jgi:hypothetical protein
MQYCLRGIYVDNKVIHIAFTVEIGCAKTLEAVDCGHFADFFIEYNPNNASLSLSLKRFTMLELWLKQVRSKALLFWDNLLQRYVYVYSVHIYRTSTYLVQPCIRFLKRSFCVQ